MNEDELNRCPHGIPHEQRKRDGCGKCDRDRADEFLAAQDAAKFRVRVIATARAVLPHVAARVEEYDSKSAGVYALRVAEAFERAADEYLKDGGAK